jgi:hypothetical protein
MAICPYCDQEMQDHVACTKPTYDDFPDGVPRARIPYGNCHDCGTPSGGLHHPGCDMERCPLCGGQAIACNCNKDR